MTYVIVCFTSYFKNMISFTFVYRVVYRMPSLINAYRQLAIANVIMYILFV